MYFVFLLAIFASFAESFGVVLLLPLLQGLESSAHAGDDTVQQALTGALNLLGLSYSISSILLLITLAFVAKGVVMFFAYTYRAWLSAHLQQNLKQRMFDCYCNMTYKHYAGSSTGHFLNVINGQVSQLLLAFESLVNLGTQVISTLVYMGLAFAIAWRFGIMAVVAAVVLLCIFRALNTYIRTLSRKTSAEYSGLTKLIVQVLHGFKYLSSTGQTKQLRKPVFESIGRLTSYHYSQGVALAIINSCREPFAVVLVAVIVYFQIVYLNQPLAPILVSILLLQRGLSSTMLIQGIWMSTLSQIGSVEMIRDEFVAQQNNRQTDGVTKIGLLSNSIDFEDVHFRYQDNADDVLKGITVSIPAKTSVAVVGESGAGKSTLVDLLTLMLLPSSGSLRIDGTDSAVIERQSWRKQIGYVSQDTVVFDDTIANNICMWSGDTKSDVDLQERIREAARQASIAEFIESLPEGYNTEVGDRGVRLSGGQKQRLFIARELFRKPRLLILDEATSALDSESEHFIQQSIDALKGQTTVVIIAHRLSTIRNVDIVYVMDKGRVVEQGSYDELRKAAGSKFERLVSMQSL